MSPIAIKENGVSVAQGNPADVKARADAARPPLPVHQEVVKPTFMYDFKYNHPLPTHGTEGLEIPKDADAVAIAGEFAAQLSEALTSADPKAFADLFLENGVWRDRVAFTWDYRTFNFRQAILKAATDLFPTSKVTEVRLAETAPIVKRPYADLSFVQAHLFIKTEMLTATGLANLILTPHGYKLWTLNTVIEGLNDFPELPDRDGHMTGPESWEKQRALDNNLADSEPEVLIIGGGQNGVMTAARLKALGISSLVIDRNERVGDNWRGRYEALSLHFPYWADHFAYMPYPLHWPTYCPASKLAEWFEWYVSAFELNVWTGSTVASSSQDAQGNWTVEIERKGHGRRTFHPKQLIMATSLAGVPYVPTFPGSETFTGTVYHSTEHISSRDYVGKKVLVVGTSSSGFDTAYDFARRGIDVTLLQRSPTYIMSLTHSVPRMIGVYAPDATGKRPDIEVADRIAMGIPHGPSEEMARRLNHELTELDYELLAGMEKAGFKTSRGQRDTGKETLGLTKNGGFYFDAGACEQIINGNIKVEQGSIDHFDKDKVVLTGGRERKFDLVVLATGFSNTIDSIRRTLGDDVASRCKPIWGVDAEGEMNGAWRHCGVENLYIVVGTLQQARYHSKPVALRIKARLEGIAPEPYLV